jgi:hypothetical protein
MAALSRNEPLGGHFRTLGMMKQEQLLGSKFKNGIRLAEIVGKFDEIDAIPEIKDDRTGFTSRQMPRRNIFEQRNNIQFLNFRFQ